MNTNNTVQKLVALAQQAATVACIRECKIHCLRVCVH